MNNEISKLGVNNTTYNIKDEKARNDIEGIKAGYIFVDSLPGIIKYNTLQEAQENYTTSKNSEILTPYIRNNKGIVFGQGFYPFENYLPLSGNIEIYSLGGGGNLIFPNSDGFNFDREGYYQDMHIHHLNIESKNICINFKGDNVTYPNNVYDSKFEFLRLKSYEKTCVYAGDNKNVASNGQLTFHLEFDHVRVSAREYGFYGLGKLNTVFREITDYDTIDVVFYNCEGIFINCNTTYAHANWFLYCDEDLPDYYGYMYDFKNCNFEDFRKGIMYFDSSNTGIRQLTMDNCTAYIDPEGDVILSKHPITFKTNSISNIDFRGFKEITFKNGKVWSEVYNMPESTLCVKTLVKEDLKTCLGDFTVLFLNDNSIHNMSLNQIMYTSSVGNSNKTKLHYQELSCDAYDGGRINKFYTLDLSQAKNVNLKFEPIIYDGIILTNASSDTNLQYIYLNEVSKNNQNGKIFTIINNSGHNITISANSGYNTRFIFENGGDSLVLGNGQCSSYISINSNNLIYFKELITQ